MNMQLIGRLTVVLLLVSLATTAAVAAEAIPEKWKSMDAKALRHEAWKLGVRQPFVEGNMELLAQCTAQRYATVAASGKLKIAEWMSLAFVLGKRLPAKTREAMVQEIEKKIAPDRQAISKLDYDLCYRAATTMLRLGSDKGHAVLAAWGEMTGALGSAKPQDTARLARALVRTGGAGKKARMRLVSHVEAKYLANPAVAGSISPALWANLAGALAADLSPEKRSTWADKLYSAFGSEASLAKMDLKTCRRAASVLRILRPKSGDAFIALWGQKTGTLGSVKPEILAEISRELARLGAAGKNARVRLVKHIEGRYLASEANARSLPPRVWAGLIEHLVADLSPEKRGAWADKLRSAFGAEASLAKMDVETYRSVVMILEKLRPREGSAFIALWGEKTGILGSVKPDVLPSLAGDLVRTGAVGRKARIRLINHIETKRMASDVATRSIPPGVWAGLVNILTADLSPEKRSAWAGKLYSAFGSEASLAKMDMETCKLAGRILARLGSDKCHAVFATWAEKTSGLQSAKPEGFVGIAEELARAGAVGANARIRLVKHIEAKYMASADSIRSLPLHVWSGVVRHLAKDMARETRNAWTDKLQAAFGSEASLAKMDLETCRRAASVLRTLAPKRGDALIALWGEKTALLGSIRPDVLAGMAGDLSRTGEVGEKARIRLVKHIEAKYLASAESIRSLPLHIWSSVVNQLAAGLSPDMRNTWVDKLLSAFGSEALLAKTDLESCRRTASMLRALNPKKGDALIALWGEKTAALGSLKPEVLLGLAGEFTRMGAVGRKAHLRLARQVETKYVASEAAIRSLPTGTWVNLIRSVAAGLPQERRSAWADKLHSVFGAGSSLSKMDFETCKNVAAVLEVLRPKKGDALIALWCEKTGTLGAVKPEALVGLAGDLVRIGDSGKKARVRLVKHVETKYLTGEATVRSVSPRVWAGLIGRFKTELSPDMRGKWADKLYSVFGAETFLAKMDLDTCRRTASMLRMLSPQKGDTLIASWCEKTAALGSVKPDVLVGVAGELAKMSDAGKKAHLRLAEHVEAKYMANDAAIRSLSQRVWSGLIGSFAAGLPKEMRNAWADKLHSAFGAKTLLAKMNLQDCRRIASMLDALCRGRGAAFVASWTEHNNTWRSFKPDGLVSLAQSMAAAGNTGKVGRGRLAKHVEAKYLANAAAIRSVRADHWRSLVNYLCADLDKKARATWAGKLYSALIAEPDPAVQARNRSVFAGILEKLVGRREPVGLLVAVVVDGDTWKSWNAAGLIDACMRLSRLGDKGRGALARLAKYVEGKYFKTNATVTSVTAGQWWDLTRYLVKTLSPESRKRWIGGLRAAFVDDAKVLKKLKPAEATAVGRALSLLGDEKGDSVVAKWVSLR